MPDILMQAGSPSPTAPSRLEASHRRQRLWRLPRDAPPAPTPPQVAQRAETRDKA